MNSYINEELVEKKNLKGNNFDLYLNLSNLYKFLFEQYLTYNVNLDKYDKMLTESNLKIIPANKDNPTLNELNEYLNYKYIYMLNYFFIEKLDESDLNVLKGINDITKIDTNAIYDLINRTFKDVINNNYVKNHYEDSEYKICYSSIASEENLARNNAVVLKIYYSVVDENLELNETIEKNKQIKNLIKYVSDQIKKDIESKISINCDVLSELVVNLK